ncbi:MAG: glutamate-1-semialdehyde 2,1-aminomutase [Chlamydiia bacterium]|nr:glutamate-1-semialdehyde 2,1-aminomutase [Chlamydiia bacterium]
MISTDQRLKSESVFEALCHYIPGGVSSPVRSFKGLLDTPLVAVRGEGGKVYDVDDNGYIDFCMSWGALIHGHAKPEIAKAAADQAYQGSSFGLTTPYELRLAEKIHELVPSCEKVRFVSSGTEATMSAMRLARGYTGRDLIVKFSGNYHGHADLLLVKAGSGVRDINKEATSKGVPQQAIQTTVSLEFNDTEGFNQFMNEKGFQVAAVIVEPIAGNMGTVPGSQEFINALRSKTLESGSVLIFDEVMTGFRVAKGGAQSLYNITPDLTCFSKIVGGGFPVGAFAGKKAIMDCLAPLGEVYQAGTLSGNPVAMAAGLKALELLDESGFYEALNHKTDIIVKPVEKRIKEKGVNVTLNRVGSMFTLFFGVKEVKSLSDVDKMDAGTFKKFFSYLFERGVLAPPSPHEAWFVSAAHKEKELEKTRDIVLEFLDQFC